MEVELTNMQHDQHQQVAPSVNSCNEVDVSMAS